MKGRTARVLAILVIMMMAFALMPVQTALAYHEGDTCPDCGIGRLILMGPDDTYDRFQCTNIECIHHSGNYEDDVLSLHTGGTATCTAKSVCEVCGTEYLDPNNHTGTSTVTGKKAATCTEAGYTGDTTWDCCGKKVEGETIAALGHKGGTATCTAKAVCEVCHSEYGDINPDNHDWGEWKVTKEATTSAEGVETRVCKNDSTHTETRAIPKKEETKEEETKKEEPKKEAAKTETVSKTTDTQPQTGDESQTVWVIMMMLSAAILIVLAIRKRRVFD